MEQVNFNRIKFLMEYDSRKNLSSHNYSSSRFLNEEINSDEKKDMIAKPGIGDENLYLPEDTEIIKEATQSDIENISFFSGKNKLMNYFIPKSKGGFYEDGTVPFHEWLPTNWSTLVVTGDVIKFSYMNEVYSAAIYNPELDKYVDNSGQVDWKALYVVDPEPNSWKAAGYFSNQGLLYKPPIVKEDTTQKVLYIVARTISEAIVLLRKFWFSTAGMVFQIVAVSVGGSGGKRGRGAWLTALVTQLDILIVLNDAVRTAWHWKAFRNKNKEETYKSYLFEWLLHHTTSNEDFVHLIEDFVFIATLGLFKLIGKGISRTRFVQEFMEWFEKKFAGGTKTYEQICEDMFDAFEKALLEKASLMKNLEYRFKSFFEGQITSFNMFLNYIRQTKPSVIMRGAGGLIPGAVVAGSAGYLITKAVELGMTRLMEKAVQDFVTDLEIKPEQLLSPALLAYNFKLLGKEDLLFKFEDFEYKHSKEDGLIYIKDSEGNWSIPVDEEEKPYPQKELIAMVWNSGFYEEQSKTIKVINDEKNNTLTINGIKYHPLKVDSFELVRK